MDCTDIAVAIAEVDSRSKSNTHRLDKLEAQTDSLRTLATAVEHIAVNQTHMATQLNKIDDKVETLEKVPASKLDAIVKCIISAIVGIIATAVIAYLRGGIA